MSGICTEDIIKPSYKMEEQCNELTSEPIVSFTESQLRSFVESIAKDIAKELIKEHHQETVRPVFQDLAAGIGNLQVEDATLKESIEKQNLIFKTLGRDPAEILNDSSDESTHENELRAKIVFSELKKVQTHFSSRDILCICKLDKKDHRTAHRVMDAAERLFPGQCKHDKSTITGSTKHWLAFIAKQE